jgi:hypothetical protein
LGRVKESVEATNERTGDGLRLGKVVVEERKR